MVGQGRVDGFGRTLGISLRQTDPRIFTPTPHGSPTWRRAYAQCAVLECINARIDDGFRLAPQHPRQGQDDRPGGLGSGGHDGARAWQHPRLGRMTACAHWCVRRTTLERPHQAGPRSSRRRETPPKPALEGAKPPLRRVCRTPDACGSTKTGPSGGRRRENPSLQVPKNATAQKSPSQPLLCRRRMVGCQGIVWAMPHGSTLCQILGSEIGHCLTNDKRTTLETRHASNDHDDIRMHPSKRRRPLRGPAHSHWSSSPSCDAIRPVRSNPSGRRYEDCACAQPRCRVGPHRLGDLQGCGLPFRRCG